MMAGLPLRLTDLHPPFPPLKTHSATAAMAPPRGRRRGLRLGAAALASVRLSNSLLGLLSLVLLPLLLVGPAGVGGSLPPMGPSSAAGFGAAATAGAGGGGQPPLPPGWVMYFHEGRAYVSRSTDSVGWNGMWGGGSTTRDAGDWPSR